MIWGWRLKWHERLLNQLSLGVMYNLNSNRPEQWDILKDLHSLMCAGLAWCHVIWWLLWQLAPLWSHVSTGNIWARPRSETRTCQCSVPTQSDTPMLLICCTTVGNFRLLRRNIMSPPQQLTAPYVGAINWTLLVAKPRRGVGSILDLCCVSRDRARATSFSWLYSKIL